MNTQIVPSSGQTQTRFSLINQHNFNGKISINAKEERITSVVAIDAKIRGSVEYSEGVKVDGEIQGSLTFGTVDGLCIISKSGVVEGDIKGPRALIMGTVEGDICIEGLLFLAPSAVVIGSISYGRIMVSDGAQISGQLNMKPEQKTITTRDDVLQNEDRSIVRLRRRNG